MTVALGVSNISIPLELTTASERLSQSGKQQPADCIWPLTILNAENVTLKAHRIPRGEAECSRSSGLAFKQQDQSISDSLKTGAGNSVHLFHNPSPISPSKPAYHHVWVKVEREGSKLPGHYGKLAQQ